jgi:hypothetical protein
MPKRAPTFKAILSEVARGDRSSLFCWLVEHHDEVIEQSAGKRMRWEPLCKRFAEHGLTDINGRPATPRTARQAWFQARRAVAEAKKRKQASDAARRPGAVYPSRPTGGQRLSRRGQRHRRSSRGYRPVRSSLRVDRA